MSEGDTFWVSFAERIFGLILIIIGAILFYLTVTTEIGGFTLLFSVLSIILVIIGIFLLVI
ncbi:MAG: hypothetical protein GX799_05010, partial [Crenarchaeota archaeon]|nr:hypothetical protein [Thermoproteota archaeon]